MHRDPKGRHLADSRTSSTGTRTAQFLRLAREKREVFHIRRPAEAGSRLAQFLRIARGRFA